MIKNDLLIERHHRPISIAQQQTLGQLLQTTMSPRKRVLKAILNTFVLWGVLLIALLMLSGVVSFFAARSELISTLQRLPALQPAVIIITALIALYSSFKWLRNFHDPYTLIAQDISCAEVIEEHYQIQDACRFQEPEFGGFIYCLKISEQAVFVIYDYDSQNTERSYANQQAPSKGKQSEFVLGNRLMLYRAPHCGHLLSYALGADALFANSTFVPTYLMALAPSDWPAADSWLDLPWSELVEHFSSVPD